MSVIAGDMVITPRHKVCQTFQSLPMTRSLGPHSVPDWPRFGAITVGSLTSDNTLAWAKCSLPVLKSWDLNVGELLLWAPPRCFQQHQGVRDLQPSGIPWLYSHIGPPCRCPYTFLVYARRKGWGQILPQQKDHEPWPTLWKTVDGWSCSGNRRTVHSSASPCPVTWSRCCIRRW